MELLTFEINGTLNGESYNTTLIGYSITDVLKTLPSHIIVASITPIDTTESKDQEIDPSEDRDNDADYYNELESNFNNIWK